MNETNLILLVLRKKLRDRGMTLHHLAREMKVSVATVKRIFSTRSQVSLARVEQITRIAGLSLTELLARANIEARKDEYYTLTTEDEKFFAKNPEMFAFFYVLLMMGDLKGLIKKYRFPKDRAYRYCRVFEKRGYLDLLPGDRIRFRIPTLINFPRGGIFSKEQGMKTKQDFFSSDFVGADALMTSQMPELTRESLDLVRARIHELTEFVRERHNIDALTRDTKQSMGLMIGFRPWRWKFLEELEAKLRAANRGRSPD